MTDFIVFEVLPASAPEASPKRRAKYPWRTMRVGQFFVVSDVTMMAKARSAATMWFKKTGMRLRCTTNDAGELIVRRIE